MNHPSATSFGRLALTALALGSIVTSSAIDLNGDGIDDLYAERFEVVGGAPGSDLDGDGFTLLVESYFETDPGDAASRPALSLEALPALRLVWPSKAGVVYVPESSADLRAWSPGGASRTGTGGFLEMEVPVGPGAGYFRLRAEPEDADGDGLRDLDEEGAGTDPLDPDTDGDGLGDGFEASDPALDPLVANDACADGNGSGKPDLEDFAATLGTGVISWIAAGDGSWHSPANWSTGSVPGAGDVVLIAPCGVGGPIVDISSDAAAAAVFGNGALVIDDAVFSLGTRLSLGSLLLRDTAVLKPLAASYARLQVEVSGDLTVETGCLIDLFGLGYPVAEGPGAAAPFTGAGAGASGGSHGGRGGLGRLTPASILGATYGSLTRPFEMGSGGSRGNAGPGGGAIRVVAGGTARIDGVITVDGRRQNSSGAGGSVWIECATFAGSGAVRANGAEAASLQGSGGGGRVAVYFGDSTFTGSLQARAGTGGFAGGAGSVYTKAFAEVRGLLVYDNGGLTHSASLTPAVAESLKLEADLLVRGAARLASPRLTVLEIETGGDVTVEADGAIDVTGMGHPPRQGPGAPVLITSAGTGESGGSHGGEGGRGRLINNPANAGVTYGSIIAPEDFGSGAGRSAGDGGGAIRMAIGGTLRVDGLVAADGESDDGAGSGGSVWIECGSWTGAGTVRADGGAAGLNNGGGGGGRVAVVSDAMAGFSGVVQARGGDTGNLPGGAGSVYLKERSSALGELRYDNGGTPNALTPIVGGELLLDADIEVLGQARLSSPLGQILTIATPGRVTFHPASGIVLTGRGHPSYAGTGAPPVPDPSQLSNGAGHAGVGGHGWMVSPALETTIYGSIMQPVAMGSGAASRGGSALRMVADEVVVEGEVRADGEAIGAPNSSGSGGSIWITCGDFSGSGLVTANGGTLSGPQVQLGGAGAGGRIAIEASALDFAGVFQAMSPSNNPGGAGTVYLNDGGVDSLVVDNGGNATLEMTALPRRTELAGHFIVRGQGRVSRPSNTSDFVLEVVARAGIEIAADGIIDYSGRALGSQVDFSFKQPAAPGGGNPPPALGGGGSHGGSGNGIVLPFAESGSPGSYPYDSAYNPRMPGSGQMAGGVIVLTTEGTMTLDGTVAADARDPNPLSPGTTYGSSGGSILLSADTIVGSGTLSARGGNAKTSSPELDLGGGGGGRIALYGNAVTEQIAVGLLGGYGDTFGSGGEPTGQGFDGTYLRACFPFNTTTGAVTEVSPPSDLGRDAREGATILMFPEHLTFAHDDPRKPDPNGPGGVPQTTVLEAVNPGTYDAPGDLVPTPVENAIWTTYLLHADPVGAGSPVLSASVTFDREIIGVVATAAGLMATNDWLGSQAAGTYRDFVATDGLELDAGDSFAISADRRTLTVTFNTADGLDQLRVVTQQRPLHEWCP